jgi:hypothetical protein
MSKLQQSDKPLSVFLHIPKTGGTALTKEITSGMLSSESLGLYSSRLFIKDVLSDHLNKLTDERRHALRYLYGHSVYYGIHSLIGRAEARYHTFLREPATLYVSLYNHALMKLGERDVDYRAEPMIDNGRILSFEEWFQRQTRSHSLQTRFTWSFWYGKQQSKATPTILKEAKKVLHKFSVIGFTEQFDASARLISEELGVSKKVFGKHNVSPRYYNPRDINEVKELMTSQGAQCDLELYDYARQLQSSRSVSNDQ